MEEPSSNEGDLVLDCFCGSGTTAAVAEKLKRRWITCDLGRFAIHTARKRLLAIPGVRPFIVQNLGKYERQLWQQQQFQGGAGNLPAPVGNLPTGTGARQPDMGRSQSPAPAARQVAAPNGPVARSTQDQADAEARQRDYVHFILKLYQAKPLNGYSWLHGVKGGRMVHVGAVDAPEDVRRTVKHWSQWIDYWAVDWDNKGDTLHNEWQTYRSRNEPKLDLETRHTYEAAGEYAVVVKVLQTEYTSLQATQFADLLVLGGRRLV